MAELAEAQQAGRQRSIEVTSLKQRAEQAEQQSQSLRAELQRVLSGRLEAFFPSIGLAWSALWRQASPGPRMEGEEPGGIPGSTLDAAVLFADASGFTALTERLAQRPNGAELMCQIMNKFFGSVIDIIHRHCGDVIKFAGDSVV